MTLLDGSAPQTGQPLEELPGSEVGAATQQPGDQAPVDGATSRVDGLVAEVRHNKVGRDLNFGTNVSVTNYVSRLAHLQPHPIVRSGIISREVFEPPAGFDDALRALMPEPGHGRGAGVLVLIAEPGNGGRTEALRLLDECLPAEARIFELFPDWEDPDASLIPDEKHTGYLLNLSGETEVQSGTFHDQLGEYARKAHERGVRLVVLTSSYGRDPWAGEFYPPLVVVRSHRPSAAGVAERRLNALADMADRVSWLHDESSVFRDLLTSSTVPSAAVHLAEIMCRAGHLKDEKARDEYLGWQHQLETWFSGSEPGSVEPRALRTVASFLDSCPARVVLDATDLLLAAPEIGWPKAPGGVLAGPDAKKRCETAGISFRADGTVSLNKGYPGIDQALLQHLWRTRPQLVPVLTGWLGRISADNGPAAGHLDQLARSLTALAQSEGPTTILDLVQQWLTENKRRKLAVQVLGDLTVHPRIGAPVRKSLRNWATAHSKPDRQQAVAEICGLQFGQDFTHVALNRLRDVLDSSREPGPENAALRTLQNLLDDPRFMAQTLTALVDWASGPPSGEPTASGSAFVRLLTLPPAVPVTDETAPVLEPSAVHALLVQEGEEGEAIGVLLRKGWLASWRRLDLRPRAAVALNGWCSAVEAGALPHGPFKNIVSVVFDEEANALSDELNQIIGGHSPLRLDLRREYAEAIRQVASGNSSASRPAPQ